MTNCPCCAAPIPSQGVVCSYCGHRIDVDLQGSGQALTQDEINALHCPDCELVLDQLILEIANGSNTGNLKISRCSNCLGIFVEREILDQILDHNVRQPSEINHRLLNNLVESNRSQPKDWRYRPCPVCRTLMHRKLQGQRSGVVVDSCREHGLWLDSGELRQLMEWSRAGGEKLDQEHLEQEKNQQSDRERRERIAATFKKSSLESDVEIKSSMLQKEPTVSILEALGTMLKDLLTD
jgi:Zn-finger nucleic acid-binding protein